MLEDAHGRAVSGVRISLTDRCNFNCVYCHNEGLGDTRGPLDPQDEEMEAADVIRFLEVVEEISTPVPAAKPQVPESALTLG
ncbi:MAG: hypothetical protein RI544_05565, partial [Haloquadratum sp.]|nr:hypothetical protein [Haloquadratum sp.]